MRYPSEALLCMGFYFFASPLRLSLFSLGRALDSRYGSAVDDVFRAGDRRSACGSKERDQVSHFLWLCWTSDWNATERVHHDFAGTFIIGAVLTRDFLDKTDCPIGFDPAGRHADDA